MCAAGDKTRNFPLKAGTVYPSPTLKALFFRHERQHIFSVCNIITKNLNYRNKMTAFCYRFVTISPYCTKIYIISSEKTAKLYAIRRACPIYIRCHPYAKVHILILKSGGWCGGFAREQPYLALFCRFFWQKYSRTSIYFTSILQHFPVLFHISAEFTAYMPYSYQILQLDGVRMPYIKIMQNAANLMYFTPILEI